jgi:hypothetical protein
MEPTIRSGRDYGDETRTSPSSGYRAWIKKFPPSAKLVLLGLNSSVALDVSATFIDGTLDSDIDWGLSELVPSAWLFRNNLWIGADSPVRQRLWG